MSFDQKTRNLLQRTVSACRKILDEEFAAQRRETYGVNDDGTAAPLETLAHLADEDMQVARLLRNRLDHLTAGLTAHGKKEAEARRESVARLTREQAFTVLNRLAALRMAEEREIVLECVRQGMASEGFLLFQQTAGSALGNTFETYRSYLFLLFDELTSDLGVLFDRWDPAALMFPGKDALEAVLMELDGIGTANKNSEFDPKEFSAIWAQDEAIGWIYQYYNDETERTKMRKESSAPRNSRELAVRNQFFTPRYVVEFLTDNTLGRIWYEMTKGRTSLKDRCRYLVRRPMEIFLVTPSLQNFTLEKNDWVSEVAHSGNFSILPENPSIESLARFALLIEGYELMETLEPSADGQQKAIDRFIDRVCNPQLEASEKSPQPWQGTTVELWCALFTIQRKRWREYSLNGRNGKSYEDACASDDFAARDIWPALRHALQHPPENLTQEELLRQPVFIPHRPLKDPREIRLLDPACGSMHFGLYAFDLFEAIYQEARDFPLAETSLAPLSSLYASNQDYLREIPKLIIEHNIHGIDIDPRAAQIAGLSLWLRAQRAWHQAGVKPADRPRITRSNLVCAEPMPGEKGLLREFVEQQFPAGERPTFAFLLETIFDCMTLAGEAGSLLRIEEEIRTAIADAKRLWKQGPKAEQASLFAEPGENADQSEMRLDLSGITDEQFWERAEQRIYDALEVYASQAENGGGFQRRLFADDAAQGFAFIDLCRKRYDVVVMNPPFGRSTDTMFEILRESFPLSYIDQYCCFVEQGISMSPGGLLGAITSRSFVNAVTLEKFRERIIAGMSQLLDLGRGVLDNAEVEVSAIVLSSISDSHIEIIDSRPDAQKELNILLKIRSFRECVIQPDSYLISKDKIKCTPKQQILYKIADFNIGVGQKTLEPAAATVRTGLNTFDNFRFIRCWWEVDSIEIKPETRWEHYSKGGNFETFFDDIHLVINRANDGAELAALNEMLHGQAAQSRQSHAYYYLPGLIYTIRAGGFNVRHFPAGCVFSIKGPVIQPSGRISIPFLAAFLNSEPIRGLVQQQGNKSQYMPSIIKGLPWEDPDAVTHDEIAKMGLECIRSKMALYAKCEENVGFAMLFPSSNCNGTLSKLVEETTCLVNRCNSDVRASSLRVSAELAKTHKFPEIDWKSEGVRLDDHDLGIESEIADAAALGARLVSFLVGIVFGRWDIRYATGERPSPELPDPFAPLRVCPPGVLQGEDGLPLSPEVGRRLRAEGRYPLDVAWDGILVDDTEHPLDLECRVHAALAVLWGDRADALAHEACELLGVPTLREWFRRPAGFFADHLKRYSKSRRQAPIYWPLSTANGSYTLWLYYHRLTPDTLFKCIELVQKKIEADVEPAIHRLRTMIAAEEAGTRERKQLADAETLLTELREFHADLTHWAPRWKPNLNDGVQITASPLWKLFRLPKWQKTLKETWQDLEKGDYDWAHLALTLRPNEVREKCKHDRSLAIAHDLEDLCEIKAPEPKKKAAKKAAKKKGITNGQEEFL